VNLPGDYKIELPPDVHPVRKGVAFWDVLGGAGVRCEVYRIPAAYPIQPSDQLTLSDMGTPDLQGGIDGMYTYYTSDIPPNFDRIHGGKWSKVKVIKGRVDARLFGPPSPYRTPPEGKHDVPMSERPFTVWIDPEADAVHIEIEDGESCILEKGQWSGWLRCGFDLGLKQSMDGMVKFYLQQAHPELRLYCSPINIDPRAPCMPISTPDDDTVVDLAEAIGPFYTQGLAEETKALQEGTIDDGEFLSNCREIHDERMKMLDYALGRFDRGLLFFYFSTIDLRCHMMWRHIEPGHPARVEALAAKYAKSIEEAYVAMDGALGHLRAAIGKETPLLVLSDHGFSPFTRRVNLNNWLAKQGYLELAPDAAAKPETKHSLAEGGGVDRAKTRAYAVGFNGLYLNQAGREAAGIVAEADRKALLEEIRGKLLALVDPKTGKKVIRRVELRDDAYHGDQVGNAPDLIVGYDRGYGASDTTALGQIKPSDLVVEDNDELWSGNHLMAPEVVPGILLSNRKFAPQDPKLEDLTVTMIRFFGVTPPAGMRGKELF
jgi:predicted AlkP superfamily phosphohydrolase/phosphomutase